MYGKVMCIHCTCIVYVTVRKMLYYESPDVLKKQPVSLQLLLWILEGKDLCTPSSQSPPPAPPHLPPPAPPSLSPPAPPSLSPPAPAPPHHPSCYLVCRLFCCQPHPKTPTQWSTSCPQFNFRQVN